MTPVNSPVDPLGLRVDAPLFDAYLHALEVERTPFTIPGHKGRTDLLGTLARADVPLHGGLDTIRLDHGALRAAEARAATLWGATWARYSVGGSTHGNQALALAVGRPGDRVVVARTLHRSLLSGLVLAGLEPVWVHPWVDPVTGLPGGVGADALAQVIDGHPDVCAVFVGEPSYVGGVGDVATLASVAHAHDLPLLVDAAWGAHFGFHPDLPPHALDAGADALVTSAHKTLPAWSQGAIVLARGELLDPDRLDRAFDMTHTTSPAGAILASIDASRALLEHHGERLLGHLVDLVTRLRSELGAIEGIEVIGAPWIEPTKIVIRVDPDGPTHIDGFAIDAALRAAGAPVEMVDRSTIIPMVTVADTPATVSVLVRVIRDVIRDAIRAAAPPARHPSTEAHDATVTEPSALRSIWVLRPETVRSPRDAAFAPHETLEADRAVGRISAELIAPYPPGVPVLAPGERITAPALELLREARDAGARIAYAADPMLASLQVLADHDPDREAYHERSTR